jgi:hypothetical protein
MTTSNATWGLSDLLTEPEYEPLLEELTPGTTAFLPVERDYDFDAADSQTLVITPKHCSEWPAQLPVALALEVEDTPSILDRFGITPERFELLRPLPAFRKAVAEAQRDVREQGHTFKLKCKGIAEDFLDSLYVELQNPQVGLSTKVDVFKYLTKMGGLEPQVAAVSAQSNAPVVQIQINL